mmetsp:Transcript_11507/g.17329  ORF Transcript_11507/g.17329 Transcript_11507/m.17329 type:complete len:98 (+) Transcript_11507:327-620(+)
MYLNPASALPAQQATSSFNKSSRYQHYGHSEAKMQEDNSKSKTDMNRMSTSGDATLIGGGMVSAKHPSRSFDSKKKMKPRNELQMICTGKNDQVMNV